MKLSSLALLLGFLVILPNLYGVLKPEAFGQAARKFPRHTPMGYFLMILATLWFLYNLSMEHVADFLTFKPALYFLFGGVGIGACLFVKDFLPVRGLAVVFLLFAKTMVDTARWVDTEWRLVIVVWAYVWILAGMWLTVSPWRLRDLIHWATSTPERTRLLSGVRLGFGVFVLFLGLTVYRSAENQVARPSTAQAHAGANVEVAQH